MRLALRGGTVLEWLALRAGLVPRPAAEAWGGMALAGVLVAAVALGLTDPARRGPGHGGRTRRRAGSRPGRDAVAPGLPALGRLRHAPVRAVPAQPRSRRWLDPGLRLSVARFVACQRGLLDWWARPARGGPDGRAGRASTRPPPDDPYWRRYIYGQLDLARLSAGEVARQVRRAAGAAVGARHRRRARLVLGPAVPPPPRPHRDRPRPARQRPDRPRDHRRGRACPTGSAIATATPSTHRPGGPYDLVMCFNLVHHLPEADIVDPVLRGSGGRCLRAGTLAVLDAFGDPSRRRSVAGGLPRLFLYLSAPVRACTGPTSSGAWLSAAGFGPPRRVADPADSGCGAVPDRPVVGFGRLARPERSVAPRPGAEVPCHASWHAARAAPATTSASTRSWPTSGGAPTGRSRCCTGSPRPGPR